MSQEQIAKYEAWAARLEENLASLAKQRRTFFGMLVGAVALSFLGFFFGWWLGVATFATGLMVFISGTYITTTRTWEYERELEATRAKRSSDSRWQRGRARASRGGERGPQSLSRGKPSLSGGKRCHSRGKHGLS